MAALVAGVGEAKEQRLVFSGYTESTTLTDFQALVKLGEGQNGFSYSDYAANDGTCGGYLFAHMRTGRECGHLYFDVSRDGLTWTQLNGGREIPLSPSYFGHPYITEDDHGPTTGTATWTSPTSTAGGALNAKSDHAVERSVMSRLRRLLPHQA